MKNLLNPRWLVIVNTIPVLTLVVLFFKQFSIIQSLLSPNTQNMWLYLGFTLLALGLLTLFVSIYLIRKGQTFTKYYALAAVVLHTIYLYLFGYHIHNLIPFEVPSWMIFGNLLYYFGSFLLPTILYALLVLVYEFSPNSADRAAWPSFTFAIMLPVIAYSFVQMILPFWQGVSSDFFNHSVLIFCIVVFLVFLFSFIRGIYIVASKKKFHLQKHSFLWKIPFTLVFPLIGLGINNGHGILDFTSSGSGVFGDFSNPWFYIVTILNAILLSLPNIDHFRIRVFLFLAKSATFVYTLYFFLIFLPLLPLSMVLILYFGMGLLMLAPLVLFAIHFVEIVRDYNYLKKEFTNRKLIALWIIGFSIIPTSIALNFLRDKNILNETLDYLYSPNYSKSYSIEIEALSRVLGEIKNNKVDGFDDFIFVSNTPYLSAFYNALVLDNLTLSDSKINAIENVFFGSPNVEFQTERMSTSDVELSGISARSSFDVSQNVWKTWVDFELTNGSTSNFGEYVTTLDLPDGCWISDYYLFVGSDKKYGILAEKKAATWIYSQIRNENKDPGILNYLTGNRVAFRVFPFAQDEVRRTGIEFLHVEPLKLKIDNEIVQLGDPDQSLHNAIEMENMAYVPFAVKQGLKEIQRQPYFHFIIDASQSQKYCANEFMERIETCISENEKLAKNAKISFVNSYAQTVNLDADWKKNYLNQNFEGGFYLDRAIRQTLSQSWNQESYPVFVVLSKKMESAIIHQDFADFKFAFPESDLFYRLGKDGQLDAYSLIGNPNQKIIKNTEFQEHQRVLEFEFSDNTKAYVPKDSTANIILKNSGFELHNVDIQEKNWLTAMALQGQYFTQTLHPEKADDIWLERVKNSFKSRIMTPETSFIVVENEAQKAMLLKKQKDVLSGKRSLDLNDDTESMSEPDIIFIAFLMLLFLWFQQLKKREIQSKSI